MIEYNKTFNFAIAGREEVGKSCLLTKLATKLHVVRHEPTFELNYFQKSYNVKCDTLIDENNHSNLNNEILDISDNQIINNKQNKIKYSINNKDFNMICKIKIYDLSGKEKYSKWIDEIINDIDGIIYIYDLSDLSSLTEVNEWNSKISKLITSTKYENKEKKLKSVLIGNKLDKLSEFTTSDNLNELNTCSDNFNKFIESSDYKNEYFLIHKNNSIFYERNISSYNLEQVNGCFDDLLIKLLIHS